MRQRWAIGGLFLFGGAVACGLSVEGQAAAPTVVEMDAEAGPRIDDSTDAADARGDSDDDGAPHRDPSAPATLRDVCEKCAACTREPDFSDDFCDPFVTSGGAGGFDVGACAANPNPDLKGRQVSNAVLDGWTCKQFDDSG